MNRRRLITIGVLMELAYLSFYFVDESANEVLLFIGVNAFTLVLLAIAYVRHKTQATIGEPRIIFFIIGFAILFRLTLVPHLPVASDDIYRYVWDGKVAASGINPFALAPSDSSLSKLHTELIPSRINFPTMRTIYPPLSQALFYISNVLFGDSISGLKFLLVIADIATIFLLIQLEGIYQFNKVGIILYAWSPLPIMYFGLDGHIDAFGIPFLLLFLLLFERNKRLSSSFALGAAVLAKLYPLFVAPFLFRLEQRWKRFLLPVIPAAMLIAGGWLYWEPTGGLIESFKVFSSEFEFNGSIFHIVYEFVKTNKQAHLVTSVLFLAWLGVVCVLDRSIVERVFLAFLGFIVFAPVVQPWYLTWLAALLVLRWSTAVLVLLGLSNLSNLVVYQYRHTGVWEESTWILVVQYLPFFVLLMWEIMKGKFTMLHHNG